jgi:hypothetical protein
VKRILLVYTIFSTYTSTAQQHKDTVVDTTQWQQVIQEIAVNAGNDIDQQFVNSTQMGKIDLPVSLLIKAPAIAGEPDIIKALQLTPGVKRGSEGSIGTYIRGGGKDENLILMDGAPVYNAGHMLGFFSVFNTAALKDVQLYKSAYPAQYGGRLSSVMDIKTKDGSLQTYKASATLGLIASSVSIQGPLIKNKLSFIVSGRRTYADKILRFIPYYFYDLNTKLFYKANEQNRIYLSTYTGNDVMELVRSGTDSAKGDYTFNTGMKLGNNIISLRWNNRPAHDRYVTDITTYFSGFRYQVDGALGSNVLSMRSAIKDIGLKVNRQWNDAGIHHVNIGFNYAYHYFNPNIVSSSGTALEQFRSGEGKRIFNQEAAIYLADDVSINEKWGINIGVRLSGAAVQHKMYIQPEPRLALRYLVNEQSSVKVSYSRMAQYMQLVSGSSVTLPTDLWYPVTENIKPGISDQVSAGYYYTIPFAGITLSTEVYYKRMKHLVEYKEGALLVLNDNYELELLHGHGNSYGLELFAGKTAGKISGWIGYALSYAKRNFDSLNNGNTYFARYDRRHDFSLVAMCEINNRLSVSGVVQYATGAPFTGQSGQYIVPKPDFTGFEILPAYTSRNALRLSSSFRIDFDLQYKFKIGNKISGNTHFSVYNVLNRTQPDQVKRVWDDKKQAYIYQQKGLFGVIPALSINFNL